MRVFKLLIAIATVTVVVLAGALGVFLATFEPNDYRELLAARVEALTGRTLSIGGDLQLTLWPAIALRAEALSVSNPDGFGDEPMLRMEALEATVQLRPLLQREVRVDGVVLYAPALDLALQDDKGQTNNWSDLQRRFATPTESADSAEVQLASVEIRNGSLSYQSESQKHRLSALNALIEIAPDQAMTALITGGWHQSAEAPSSPFKFQTRFNKDGNQLLLGETSLNAADLPAPLTSDLNIQAQRIVQDDEGVRVSALVGDATFNGLPIQFGAPEVVVDSSFDSGTAENLYVEVADSRFDLQLTASNLLESPRATGKLSTQDANSGALVNAFDVSLPVAVIPAQLGPLDLVAGFNANATGALQLSGLIAEFKKLGVQASATIDVTPAGNAQGEVTVADIDLRKLSQQLPGLLPPETFGGPRAGAQLDRLGSTFSWRAGTGAAPGRLDFKEARFAALGLTGSFSGHMLGEQLTAAVQLQPFNPRVVLEYFIDPIETADDAALGNAAGSATVVRETDHTRLNNLKFRLDKSSISGWLSQGSDGLQFDLGVDRLDTTGYLPPDEEPQRGATALREVDANQALLGAMELPTELLRAYRLNGVLRINDLRFFDLVMSGVSGALVLGSGSARAQNVSARLYGGSFKGDFSVVHANLNDAPTLAIKGDLQGIKIDQLLLALTDSASFAGLGAVQLNLKGTGNSMLEATQNSGGSLALAFEQGRFDGVDLGHKLCELYNRLRSHPLPPPSPTTSTTFDKFAATATVTNGEATTTDLSASNSYLKLTGAGRARLARQSIYYDLDVELTSPIEHPNCETLTPYIGNRIPVKLSGTFTNPIVRPDFGKLVKREIRRRVEEKLTEKLLDLLGGKEDPTP